jgi:ammonium transporter
LRLSQEQFDIGWILVTGILVFVMQAGFMCLECGMTRSKNSINVAIKNLTDFQICFVLFWAVGFGMMFGPSHLGLVGTADFLVPLDTATPWRVSFFFFQAMFAATASTILSGAIAERTRFSAYMLMSAVVSVCVYPLFGHWAWNVADGTSSGGWLFNMGFVDFAGSSVVHSVGGWISLAALLVIGAREGRFVPGEPVKKITGHSLQLSVLGTLILFFGWFGFNGGSTLALNDAVPKIIANTALAASVGALTTLALGWLLRGRPDVELVMNGCLAGLVAITANCHAVSAFDAVIIGGIGGAVMLGCDWLLEHFRIDDAVGAVPVHLGAGIWGTLAVAIFGDLDILGHGLTRQQHFLVQLEGVVVCGLWAFGFMFLLLTVINKFFPLRIHADAEYCGLNVAEHGASTELIDLMNAMERQGKVGDLSMRVPVEPFTEVGQIASQYNSVMDLLQRAVNHAESVLRDMQDGILTFNREGVVTSFNPGAEKLFGVSAEEAIGGQVAALLAPQSKLDMAAITGERGAYVVETTGAHRRNGAFAAELRVSRSRVGDEEQYTALVKDITELKKAQEALKASRDSIHRQNAAMAHLTATGAEIRGDFDRMILAIAQVASETLEARSATLWRFDTASRQLSLVTQSHQDGRDLQLDTALDLTGSVALGAAIENARIIVVEDVWTDPRTQQLWGGYLSPRSVLSLLAAPVRMSGGVWGVLFVEHAGNKRAWTSEEQQFVGSMADYVALACEDAERRRAEELVRRMNQELENHVALRTEELNLSNKDLRSALETLQQAQRQLVQTEKMAALGELVAGVAHEINTPVGVALTAASHLELQTQNVVREFEVGTLKRSSLERYIGHADESTKMLLANLIRASELVQSFKKVAVDQSSEARRTFAMRQYLQEILLSLRPKLKRTQHRVLIEGPDDLELNSFPGAFSQVVTNLIVNSLVHAFDNMEDGIIRIEFNQDGSLAVLHYHDNGKGIDDQHLPRIFDPFFTTKRGQGGSGLGLHLVYNIVTATLRGTIECESEVGKGTHFIIRVPMNPELSGATA